MKLTDGATRRAGSASIFSNSSLHRPRRRRAERFIATNGLAEFLAHQLEATGQLRIVGKRAFDARRIATAQRAGGVPRQQQLDLVVILWCFVRCGVHGQPLSIPAAFKEFRQFLPRIKHARFDGILRDANDLSHLFHGLLVVVDEIDNLPMIRRQCFDALAQDLALILLLHGGFGGVGDILDRLCNLIVQLSLPCDRAGPKEP